MGFRKLLWGVWFACALVTLGVAGECKTIYVSVATGIDTNDGLSWESAKRSIGAGVSTAAQGDEIWVARGEYAGPILIDKGVGLYGGFAGTETVRDQRDWKADPTVLDGKHQAVVVSCVTASTVGEIRVDGFVIRNGLATGSGGGVYCKAKLPVVICNNVIVDNRSGSGSGGGVGIDDTTVLIANNIFRGNVAVVAGGAVYASALAGPKQRVVNNVMYGNAAPFGAAAAFQARDVTVAGNTMFGNEGSAVYFNTCWSSTLSNNIIAYNTRGVESYQSSPVLRNNCVFNPDGEDYINTQPGIGDISVDPKLVDWKYGGFHIASDSPCRDAGWNDAVEAGAVDIDGQPRIMPAGGAVDIGADEWDGVTAGLVPQVVRVRTDGDNANDGSNWNLAKKTVQAGIDAAALVGGEVWVAQGIYSERIALKQSVYVYGGFSGTESSRDERDWKANKTTLDGAKGGSVVTAMGIGYRLAALDGFSVVNGAATDGGGINCTSAGPVIANNEIRGNIATSNGGGVYCDRGSPDLRSNLIAGNVAENGGGVYYGYQATARTHANAIESNRARNGGGIHCSAYSLPKIDGNLIAGNIAEFGSNGGRGGGIYSSAISTLITNNVIRANSSNGEGGGICGYTSDTAKLEILNNVIAGNNAHVKGQGILCLSAASTSNINITGNTITGHSGTGIEASSGILKLYNNIIAFNLVGAQLASLSLERRNNCLYNPDGSNYVGLSTGMGDILADPRIANLSQGGYHIAPDSPCRDAGWNGVVAAGALDIDGQPRVQPVDGTVDIGADESDGTAPGVIVPVVRVRTDGNDSNDGSTWALAKKTVQAGIDRAALTGGEVWVAGGVYSERVTLKTNALVYGGFAGTESSRDERDRLRNETILDGGAVGSVVTATKISARMAVLDGFTITNGKAANGAAIICTDAGPVISNNIITRNTASDSLGGSVYCLGSNAVICGNVISRNAAMGIYCSGTVSPFITGNTIVGNGKTGLYVQSGRPTIINNIIAFNNKGIFLSDKTAPVRYNCFWNESDDTVPEPDHNVFADPMIAGWQAGDYHIQPDSPCRNAGWNEAPGMAATDIDGQPRISTEDGRVDIGADESDGVVRVVDSMVIRVSPDGDDANDGLSWQLAKKTVQAGLDAAMLVGGEVWVKAGTYVERIKPNATLPINYVVRPYAYLYGGFAGTETSRYERDWKANASILDGSAAGSVVTTYDSNRWIAAVDGFTIRNGVSSQGAGIKCASPTAITNNVIAGNPNPNSGRSIYCLVGFNGAMPHRRPLISNNLIAGAGGGVACNRQPAVITNNRIASGSIVCQATMKTEPPILISNNSIVGSTGAGVLVDKLSTSWTAGTGTVEIVSNTIIECAGPAIQCVWDTHPLVISNNILAFNQAGLVDASSSSPVTLRNNCFYNPSGKERRYVPAGDGDIFVDPGLVMGWWNGDGRVHIRPDSPCRDAGWNGAPGMSVVDIDGEARLQPVDGIVDIGADEFSGTVWPEPEVRVVYVKPDGDDANDGSSWGLAKKTVQAGIDAAADTGGQVWVSAGTYNERVSVKRYVYLYGGFVGTEKTLSERPGFPRPAVDVAASVLDGEKKGTVVTFASAGSFCGADGFVIRNGFSTIQASGGGVMAESSSPVISNNVITGCTAGYGYGVCLIKSAGRVINNILYGNSLSGYNYGGANVWASEGGSHVISGNVIKGGTGVYTAGIHIRNCGSALISGNLVTDNSASGVSATTTRVTVVGNTLVANGKSDYKYGITCENCTGLVANNIVAHSSIGIEIDLPGTELRNNNVYCPKGRNYSVVQAGAGDISADPLFVDMARGDFHLKPTSPCINAGWNDAPGMAERDMDGQKRVCGGTVDIGADEWWQSVADAKRAGGMLELSGAVVTAAFRDFFYIESDDRACGIRVENAGHGVALGTRADVVGVLSTNSHGERCILAGGTEAFGTGLLQPLGLSNRGLGGSESEVQGGVWSWVLVKQPDNSYKRVWMPLSGLNSTGLFVKIWGRVTHVGDGFFYVDDGSGLDDDSGYRGVRVYGSVAPDSMGRMVTVTGISSCERLKADPVRVILTRKAGDIIID